MGVRAINTLDIDTQDYRDKLMSILRSQIEQVNQMKEKVYLKKLEKDGLYLKQIPEKERVVALCLVAVKQNGLAITYVPPESVTEEICREAVSQYSFAIHFIPACFQTPEICQLAVEKEWSALCLIDENKRTSELCRVALTQNPNAKKYVPWNLKKSLVDVLYYSDPI